MCVCVCILCVCVCVLSDQLNNVLLSCCPSLCNDVLYVWSICAQGNGIYAEVEEDSNADKFQTPLTPTNQNQQQDSAPVISIYTTANYSPDELPASSQATNQLSGVTNPNSLSVYSVLANPVTPIEMPVANQNSEINGIYSLAVNPVQPTDLSDKQSSPTNGT